MLVIPRGWSEIVCCGCQPVVLASQAVWIGGDGSMCQVIGMGVAAPPVCYRYHSVAEGSLVVAVHFCGTSKTLNCGTLSLMRNAVDIDEW